MTPSASLGARFRSLAGDVEPFRIPRLLYYAALIPISATAFRPFADLTLSDWLFFAALVALIFEVSATRGKAMRGLPPLLIYGAVAFAIGGLASSLYASYPSRSLGVLARLLYLTLVWFWLGVMVLRSRRHIIVAVTLWVLSAAIAGSSAIAQAIWGYAVIPRGLAGPNFAIVYAGFRDAGITLHPNDLGSITAFALVPCVVLLTRSRGPVTVITFAASLTLIVGGLVISGSVGAFVAAAMSVVGWIVAFRKLPRHILLLGAVGVAAIAFILLAPQALRFASPLQRIAQVTAHTSTSSLNSRLQLDAATVDVMIRRPLIGVGLDPMSQSRWVKSPPENMFLLVWLGGGLFALAGIVVVVIACLREGLRELRSLDVSIPRDISVALFISFLSTLVFAMASPVLQQRYVWLSAAILLAVHATPPQAAALEPAAQLTHAPSI